MPQFLTAEEIDTLPRAKAKPRPEMRTDVLVIGAGPTGLVLALWLTHMGVRVRVIDQAPEAGTTSRALVVQARTLELYRPFGLADEVIRRGRKVMRKTAQLSEAERKEREDMMLKQIAETMRLRPPSS